MKHCSQCGNRVNYVVPDGDNRKRHVCPECGTIHYQNPRIVVGCIAEWDGRIILCQRAIEPRHGYWTLPAGYLENSETTEQGAARESAEEACIDVEVGDPFTIISVPHINQVHLMFLGKLRGPEHAAGEESLAVKLFEEAEIPWLELAFPTVGITLRHYFADRQRDRFGFHSEVIEHRQAPTSSTG